VPPRSNGVSLGITLWNQAATWAEFEGAAMRADQLGYDHVWTWDHLYAITGDPYQPVFEGYVALGALAKVTSRTRLGLFVGANTFRNPGLVAKSLATLDHASGGRIIAGLGAAWNELEHEAYGIEFGRSPGERLDWLDEAVAAVRALFAGEAVTSPPGGRYAFRDLRLIPPPVQRPLPIMIGGSGERKTLRIVARHADMWNTGGSPERIAHKLAVLREHCRAVGRNIADIELTVGCKPLIRDSRAEALRVWTAQMAHNRAPADLDADELTWIGSPDEVAAAMRARTELGFRTFMAELPAPYDVETMERWIGEVVPMVAGSVAPPP
jgi:alkanesulfonate monooxygenase SsuD/methylene tetrahydromethanopterin reductase-like flavin-dependent oxidoreductase (luciferase family)